MRFTSEEVSTRRVFLFSSAEHDPSRRVVTKFANDPRQDSRPRLVLTGEEARGTGCGVSSSNKEGKKVDRWIRFARREARRRMLYHNGEKRRDKSSK